MTKHRHVLIIVNPEAGKRNSGKKLIPIEKALGKKNIGFKYFFTKKDGKGLLRNELTDHPEITDLFVAGGDGTLNYVVNEMEGRKIPVSIISLGTGNDSVKSLHGVTDFQEQLDIALNGQIKVYDLGICNDRLFVNGTGIGFDGEVVNYMEKKGYKSGNSLTYFMAVLKIIAGYREKTMRFEIDGQPFEKKLFLMTVSNGTTFGGNFLINPFAKTDDGLLDICMISEISVMQRFRHLPKMKKGKHVKLDFTEFRTCRHVYVHAHDEIVAHLDGELIGHPPFDIRLAKEKLFLRVPGERT